MSIKPNTAFSSLCPSILKKFQTSNTEQTQLQTNSSNMKYHTIFFLCGLLAPLAYASVAPVALDAETLSSEIELNLTERKGRGGGGNRGDASGMSANIGLILAGAVAGTLFGGGL
ncbi:hypothetical protein DL98DRAFT_596839 [Cadophora sp. DSE1049]|nr:hypothetical protein DL98DRAFT_596839 [Cadophora sp. DSE1049]